ncbi:hypothetical protein ACWCQ1_47805 [Streptomyces sp. NPDC002144]
MNSDANTPGHATPPPWAPAYGAHPQPERIAWYSVDNPASTPPDPPSPQPPARRGLLRRRLLHAGLAVALIVLACLTARALTSGH